MLTVGRKAYGDAEAEAAQAAGCGKEEADGTGRAEAKHHCNHAR